MSLHAVALFAHVVGALPFITVCCTSSAVLPGDLWLNPTAMSRLHNNRPGFTSPCGARDSFQPAIMTGRRVAAREGRGAASYRAADRRCALGTAAQSSFAPARYRQDGSVGLCPRLPLRGGPPRREVSW